MPFLKYPSKTEIGIVRILMEKKKRMTSYEVTKEYYGIENPQKIVGNNRFVNKILKDLNKRGIVERINSYPVYYQIAKMMEEKKYEFILYEIKCPTCKKEHWVMDGAKTKQCTCLSPNKSPRRFWITKNVYTGNKKVI